MARSINKVCLLGHLGRDPEIRATAGGTIVASLALATSERRKGQDGEWQDATEWHNLIAFNRTAEICRDYLGKGSQIHVEGALRTRSWDDRETGQKKYRTEIVVNELIMLGQPVKPNGHAPAEPPHYDRANAGHVAQNVEANMHGEYIGDDDIPF